MLGKRCVRRLPSGSPAPSTSISTAAGRVSSPSRRRGRASGPNAGSISIPGWTCRAGGRAADAYQSFDQAAERLEKRLRRYKRRLKDHHADQGGDTLPAAIDYVIAAPDEEADAIETVDDNPVVIAETQAVLGRMTVSMAVMAMDLSEAPLEVFRNAASGRFNVVYRRADGNIGWIDLPDAGEREARG